MQVLAGFPMDTPAGTSELPAPVVILTQQDEWWTLTAALLHSGRSVFGPGKKGCNHLFLVAFYPVFLQ